MIRTRTHLVALTALLTLTAVACDAGPTDDLASTSLSLAAGTHGASTTLDLEPTVQSLELEISWLDATGSADHRLPTAVEDANQAHRYPSRVVRLTLLPHDPMGQVQTLEMTVFPFEAGRRIVDIDQRLGALDARTFELVIEHVGPRAPGSLVVDVTGIEAPTIDVPAQVQGAVTDPDRWI